MSTKTGGYFHRALQTRKARLFFICIFIMFFFSAYLSRVNYLLFHTFMELIDIMIGFTITIIVISTYKLKENSQLAFLGISYGFISTIQLIHTLSYEGMNLIPGVGVNEAIQLSVAGRFMESITFLMVSLLLYRGINHHRVIGIYGITTLLLLLSIFYWNIFPDCYLPIIGLTPFKKISEGVICLILFISIIFLKRNRTFYNKRTYLFLIHSFGFTILGEVVFMFYRNTEDPFSIIGHYFMMVSFYFIYKAIVEVTLKSPYYLLEERHREFLEENLTRIQVQEDLQTEEVVLQKTINSLDEGIIVIGNKGNILHYNDKFLKLWHMHQGRVSKMEDVQIRNYLLEQVINREEFQDIFQKENYPHYEMSHEILLKDGRCFELFSNPFQVHNVKGIVYSFRDITQRKIWEKKIEESEKNFRLLLANIPDAILVHQNLQCVYANPAAVKLLGVESQEALIGTYIHDFIPPEQQEDFKRKIKEIGREKQQHVNQEYNIIDRNKKTHQIEAHSSIYTQDGIQTVLTVIRDITEEKIAEAREREIKEREIRYEERRKINEFRIDFFTNLSHDLKTPLNIISAVSYMIKDGLKESSPMMRKYTQLLNQNCNRMIRMVNNLIDINKMDSGHFEIDMKNYNIIQIVEEISMSVVPYMETKDISFTFDTDVEEKIIGVDVNAIERIILNLLSNAIKFTKPKGKIQVMIKDLGEEVEIAIRDTGTGIDQDQLESIFKRFKQGDVSPEYNPLGSGVGLYIVKHMVKMHGGRVQVYSEKGKGSEFKVFLPARVIEDPQEMVECQVAAFREMGYEDILKVELSDIQ